MPRAYSTSRSRRFSFYLFWLVFWLTVIATVMMSWKLIVVPNGWSPLEMLPATPMPGM